MSAVKRNMKIKWINCMIYKARGYLSVMAVGFSWPPYQTMSPFFIPLNTAVLHTRAPAFMWCIINPSLVSRSPQSPQRATQTLSPQTPRSVSENSRRRVVSAFDEVDVPGLIPRIVAHTAPPRNGQTWYHHKFKWLRPACRIIAADCKARFEESWASHQQSRQSVKVLRGIRGPWRLSSWLEGENGRPITSDRCPIK